MPEKKTPLGSKTNGMLKIGSQNSLVGCSSFHFHLKASLCFGGYLGHNHFTFLTAKDFCLTEATMLLLLAKHSSTSTTKSGV